MDQQIFFGAKQSSKNFFFALLLVMPVDTLYIIFLVWVMKTGQFSVWHIFPLAAISMVLFAFIVLSKSGKIFFDAGKVVITSKLFGRKILEAQIGEVQTVEMQAQADSDMGEEKNVIVLTLQNGKAVDFFLEKEEETKVLLAQVGQAVGR